MNISEHLSFFAALYKVQENPNVNMWYLYITIVLLSIIVYKLGFSRKLPLVKATVVYVFLFLGCTFLTFLGVFLPIAEGLSIAAVVLIIYKLRHYQEKKLKGSKSV